MKTEVLNDAIFNDIECLLTNIFKDTPLFDVECLRNDTEQTHGYYRPLIESDIAY